MATRTPALQTRSQYHRNWGNYTDGGVTTPANGDLPNQPSNPLPDPEFSKLEAGDLAYVTTTDPGVYYCVSPGTVGGGDAVWSLLDAGGAVQTIRDAHQIVVGQSSAPYSNVLSQDADFVDPGDGTGVEAALAAASALILSGYFGVDVRVRPCDITIDPTAVSALPMTVDSNVRLIGAGAFQSSITGGDGDGGSTQDIFALFTSASIEDFTLTSPAPTSAPGGGSGMVTSTASFARVSDCIMNLARNPAIPRNGTVNCIAFQQPEGAVAERCLFNPADLIPDAQESVGVRFGAILVPAFIRTDVDPVVRDCEMTGGNRLVSMNDHEGGVVRDCQHNNAIDPLASVSWTVATAPGTSDPIRGPRISGFRLSVADSDQQDHIGIVVQNNQDTAFVAAVEISDIKLFWEGVTNPANTRDGILIITSGPGGGDTAEIEEVGISNVNIVGPPNIAPANGVRVSVQGDDDVIMSVSIVNLGTTNTPDRGVYFETLGQSAVISECSVSNSKLRNAGTAGVEIDTGCVDCIVLGNNFSGSAAGVIDAGTGTEQAHNIP